MPRAPLADLPLERFLPSLSDSNIPSTSSSPFKHPGSHKRPLSPGPTPFSPAKRRILAQEGLFSPPKPPSPAASSSRSFAQAYSHHLGSSVRKLDFGAPPDAVTPRRRRRSSQATPMKGSRTSPRLAKRSPRSPASPTIPASRSAPMLVPREMPPPPDRQSVHYPGFDVHQDTHLVLPVAGSNTDAASSAGESDDVKENVPPRRRLRKSVGKGKAPAVATPSATPRGLRDWNERTPRRSARISAGSATPGSGGKSTPAQERKERRRAMMDEEALTGDEENVAL